MSGPSQQAAYVPVLTPKELQIGTANANGLWIAPAGTALPLTAAAAFATPWALLGYVSDQGVTVGQSLTKQDIVPWQSRVPIRSVVTEKLITMKFILWQINPQTVALYFDQPQPVPVADGSFEMDIITGQPQNIMAVAVDSLDQRVMRVGFTRASLTVTGDMTIAKGAAVPLEVTLTALDNAGVMGHVSVGATPTLLAEEAGLAPDNGGNKKAA
jgi:hypothetical protein